jgi:hypothetical protein
MENSTQTKIKLAPTQIWGMWGTIASAVPRGRSRAASRSAPSVGEQKTKIKERRKSRETAPEWKCGRASHPTAFVRGFLRCLITAWRRNDRFGPTALLLSRATSAACAKRVAHSQSRDHELASLRWPTVRPNSLLLRATSRWGEEAAMPGQPVALARVAGMSPGDSPSRITRLPLALPQSFGKLRKLHVSLDPLSVRSLRLATQKTHPLVQKLWTM